MKRIGAILAFLLVGVLAHAQTLSRVEVSPHGASMQSGTLQMSVTCYYSNSTTDNCSGKTVTWYSSEPYITVSSSGLAAYATNCGTAKYGSSTVALAVVCMANIVATVTTGSTRVNDYATILAQYPSDVYQVILTPGIYESVVNSAVIPSTLVVGSTATIGAGFGVNGSLSGLNPFPGCNWTSSNTAVGTIDRYGFFTAVAPGTSTVSCNMAGNANVSNGVASYVVTVIPGGTGGNTWYVRPGGGTPYTNSTDTPVGQCNGLANAAYPGSGVNQACAFGDFEDLYYDQTTNKKQWVISGGDTVIVYPKTAGYNTAIITSGSAPTNCGGDYEYCSTPYIPSGTTAQPTRILGSNYADCTGDHGPNPAATTLLLGYGRYLLNAVLSQNIDVECFELADSATSAAGIGFTYGMIQSAFTSNATFKNLFIHNATAYGVNGATGVNVTYDHVHIRAAAFTGYQMDDAFTTAGWGLSNISTSGGLNLTYSDIEWTGCREIYGSSAQYPFTTGGCLDENTGGQGDGIGTGSMTGTWLYDHDIFRYNFQDGLDNLHAGGQSLTLTNSLSYGNDGQQFKIGSMDKAIMQNNIALGNCSRIMQPFNGVVLAHTGVNPCRAGGGTFIFEWANTGSYIVQNNTIISIGDEALGEECEVTWASCANANTVLQNNIIAGYTGSSAAYGYGALTDGIYLGAAPQLPSPVYPFGINPTNLGWATRSNNDFYNVTSYTPTTTAELVVDPLLTSEPPFLTELTDSTESVLDNYNFMPGSGSQVLGTGLSLANLTTDANGFMRANPPSIGALESTTGTTQSASQVTLSATPNPVSVGQQITLTASITSTSVNGVVPTGTVIFSSNGTSLGSGVVSNAGLATLTVSLSAAGSDTLTATYSGDATFAQGASPALSLTVNPAPAVATTTVLQSSSNPITAGQTVTLTATVAQGSGGNLSGTISFLSNGVVLGTAPVNSAGIASYTPASMAAGAYSLTAQYGGNSSFAASTSSPLSETVNPVPAAATTTMLQASSNPIAAGQAVTLMATVVAPSGGTPSGTVSFLINGVILGTASVNSAGSATYTPASMTAGTYSLTAQYVGNTSFAASTSSPLNETVNPAPAVATTTMLQASSNPITAGQTVTLAATVVAGSGGHPSGTVSFLGNGVVLGTAALNSAGVATLSTASMAAGSYSITAQYGGNSSFAASTSSPLSETVNPAPAVATTTMLQASSNPIAAGQTVTLAATVVAPSGGTPSGTVSFLGNGVILGTAPVNSAGSATYTPASMTAGTYSITAQYGGNSSFAASTSSPLSETVTAAGVAAGIGVTASTPTLTIGSGSSTSDAEVLTLTAVGGYSGTITMACANLPAGSTCSFQPPTVTVSSATSPVTVVMTIQNSGTSTTASLGMHSAMMHDTTLAAIFWIPGLFASALIGKKRKLLFQTRFLLLLLLVGGVFGGLTGCGTSSYTAIPQAVQTTPFQVMVTGTGNVTQTISLTVTVQ